MSEEYKRDSFIFYGSIRDATKDIDDPMIRLEIYEAVIDYSLYKIEPSDISSMAMVVFKLLKPNLDTQRANSENGKKGGLMKKKKPTSENSESPLAEIPKARFLKMKKPACRKLKSPLPKFPKAIDIKIKIKIEIDIEMGIKIKIKIALTLLILIYLFPQQQKKKLKKRSCPTITKSLAKASG